MMWGFRIQLYQCAVIYACLIRIFAQTVDDPRVYMYMPRNLSVVPGVNNLDVKWLAPKAQMSNSITEKRELLYYMVEVKSKADLSRQEIDLNYWVYAGEEMFSKSIGCLKPDTTYTVSVSTKYDNYSNSSSVQSYVKTLPGERETWVTGIWNHKSYVGIGAGLMCAIFIVAGLGLLTSKSVQACRRRRYQLNTEEKTYSYHENHRAHNGNTRAVQNSTSTTGSPSSSRVPVFRTPMPSNVATSSPTMRLDRAPARPPKSWKTHNKSFDSNSQDNDFQEIYQNVQDNNFAYANCPY